MTHFSVGKERLTLARCWLWNDDDLPTSNHRGHGQVIAKGIDLIGTMAEILGNIPVLVVGKAPSAYR